MFLQQSLTILSTQVPYYTPPFLSFILYISVDLHCRYTVQISKTAEISQNTRLEIAIEAPRHSSILTQASFVKQVFYPIYQCLNRPRTSTSTEVRGLDQNQQAVPRSRTSTGATTMTRTVAIKTHALNHRFDIERRIQEASFEVCH